MRAWGEVIVTVLVILCAWPQQTASGTERMLKARSYTFNCGQALECVGWRHSFAYLDPTARDAELPQETYIDVYSVPEIDALLASRDSRLEAGLKTMIDDALKDRAGTPASLTDEERRRLRDDIAADVVEQLSRLMAEREAQTRAWLRSQIRDELRAAGVGR